MSYDHLHCRTLTNQLAAIPNREPHHGCSTVEGPDAALGHPLDLQLLAGEEPLGCVARDRGVHLRELQSPQSRFQAVGERSRPRDYDVQDVKPVGQGFVQGTSYVVRLASAGDPDLEVLRLTGRPGR